MYIYFIYKALLIVTKLIFIKINSKTLSFTLHHFDKYYNSYDDDKPSAQ